MLTLDMRLFLVIFVAAGVVAPMTRAAHGQTSGTAGPGTAAPKLPERALVQIGTNNLRTRGFITQLVFSPDGQQIAAVGASGEDFPMVSIFDVATGLPAKEVRVPDAVQSRTTCLAFSPDGKKLLWGEVDGHLALWDLAGDKLLYREKLHTAEVNSVVYSPRGNVVASCSSNGEIHLRDASNLSEPVRLVSLGDATPAGKGAGFFGAVSGYVIAFSPNGELLLVASKDDGQIYVWNVTDGELDHKVELAHGDGKGSVNPRLNAVAVTPDGRQIMTAGQRTVRREETKLKYVSKNVTLSQIYFWDLKSGKRTSVLNGDEDLGFGYAALSPDGKTVAVGDFSRLNLWDVAGSKLIRSIKLPGWWGSQPVFSPDGKLVAIANHNAVGLFEAATGKRLQHDDSMPIGEVGSSCWSPDGKRIVTGHSDGYVRCWDSHSGALVWRHELAPVISLSGYTAGPAFVGFTPDGKSVVVAGRRDEPVEFRDGIIAVLEADTGNPRREIPMKQIRHGALSPDGQTIVAATTHGAANDTQLFAFDVATGKSLFETPGSFWMVAAIQFRADSQELLLATKNGDVFGFDAATGRVKWNFAADYRTAEQIQAGRPQRPGLWSAAFSGDGKTLVSSSAETIYVWDFETGTLRLQFRHPHDHGRNLCLAPDGKTLATSDMQYPGDYGNDTARLYDIDTGDELLTLELTGNRAAVMSFSPDGKRLFTGSHRGSAFVWDVGR